jgi:hypothetical protein
LDRDALIRLRGKDAGHAWPRRNRDVLIGIVARTAEAEE